jgi:hypothetical protein
VLNSITFDNSAEQFVFTADVSLFDGLVQIPDQVNEFHLFITQSATSSNTPLALPPFPSGPQPPAVVPEPNTMMLLVAGLALAGLMRRYHAATAAEAPLAARSTLSSNGRSWTSAFDP